MEQRRPLNIAKTKMGGIWGGRAERNVSGRKTSCASVAVARGTGEKTTKA